MSESNQLSQRQVEWFARQFELLVGGVERVMVGKRDAVTLTLIALVAEGHVLLEDVPGTGKTSLAKAISQTIEGKTSRIQFTPDLLPSDVTGSTIYNQAQGIFEFHNGPVFANIVLGDEINRASAKTQSALLEVMEERQVTIDATPYPVPRPFMVIATQNPIEFEGTYRLPEAQVDRFLIKMSIGYVSAEQEMDVLARHGRTSSAQLAPVMGLSQVRTMNQFADLVHVEPSIARYVVELAHATRSLPEVRLGVSTRGCLALMKAARVRAIASGRDFVTPDDVKALARPTLEHRLILSPESEMRGVTPTDLVERVVGSVSAPRIVHR